LKKTEDQGGIIIPDTAKEKPQMGEVIAAGPGRKSEDGKLVALDVKKGDRVSSQSIQATTSRLMEKSADHERR